MNNKDEVKSIRLIDVLSEDQIKKIEKISNDKRNIYDRSVHNAIMDVLKLDDSKWKDKFIGDYLAYAIQANIGNARSGISRC